MKLNFIVLVLVALLSSFSAAKRPAPIPIEPIQQNNIVYSVPHWTHENEMNQHGGVISATDTATGKLLWRIKVYSTEYAKDLERDVQDVFIQSIELVHDKEILIVRNELGQIFQVNIKTKQVTVIEP